MVECEVWFIFYYMKVVCFLVYKDLLGFDFVVSEVNEVFVW